MIGDVLGSVRSDPESAPVVTPPIRQLLSAVMAAAALVMAVFVGGCDRYGPSPEIPGETTSTTTFPGPTQNQSPGGEWDVVVLGKVDLCGVCQRDSPTVTYSRVLAGETATRKTAGTLPIAGVAPHLLPSGGVPLYQSQREEIVLLKMIDNRDLYFVVDVLEATPDNMALFHHK